MQLSNKFLDIWCTKKTESKSDTYKASPEFLRKFGNLRLRPLERKWLMEPVKQKEMVENGFSEKEVEDSQRFLTRLNGFYSSIRLDIQIPYSGITAEDMVQLSRFHSIPYLVKKPRAGGRFFHPGVSYQRISSSLRPLITINGEETSEIDLSASVLQFLGIVAKGIVSEKRLGLGNGADPYLYFLDELNSKENLDLYQENPISRDELKKVLYTAAFSLRDSQELNLNRKLRQMNRNYTHKGLENLFPDFFEMLKKLKEHSPLHQTVFREESRYAQRVLEEGCLKEGVIIFPIHDSFITSKKKIKALSNIMNNVSKKLYGRKLIYKVKY